MPAVMSVEVIGTDSTDSAQILFRRPHPVQLQSLEKTTRLVQVLLTQEGHSDEEAESQRVDSSPTVAQRNNLTSQPGPDESARWSPSQKQNQRVRGAGGCKSHAGVAVCGLTLNVSGQEAGDPTIRVYSALPTRGVDFKIKTVELRGKKIRLQIWDTAGQERFNSITSAYYRSAKGIILVYDITKKETFDDLPKWMKMIDKYASEDAELLLVGNKLDCETDREISRQQGEKFAQQIAGMRFCEASAKDNFNVDEIFLKLVDDILKKMPLDMLRNELSNSILSLQPEPEIPPELPPPRPHVRCC
ncbi:PREDICTED: ras-related protein Rab-12 [Bison bison bison]|uniref:Ras-related protein Rab-12 n=1 Tax=Bison bison bison TaxID=43346 RepID=A0A6P3IT41_BISBB|nr:PREDICTED: ras-related protein Rab-12 [Bison bison bison]